MNAVYPFQKSPRCSATSKRTRRPCMAPAVTGWTVCRFHGARGGGPKGKANGAYSMGSTRKRLRRSAASSRTYFGNRAQYYEPPLCQLSPASRAHFGGVAEHGFTGWPCVGLFLRFRPPVLVGFAILNGRPSPRSSASVASHAERTPGFSEIAREISF
jgi:hypothetical protein